MPARGRGRGRLRQGGTGLHRPRVPRRGERTHLPQPGYLVDVGPDPVGADRGAAARCRRHRGGRGDGPVRRCAGRAGLRSGSVAAHRLAGGAGGRRVGHGGIGRGAGARLREVRPRGRHRRRHLQPHRKRETRGAVAASHAARGHSRLRLRHAQRMPGAAGPSSRPGPGPGAPGPGRLSRAGRGANRPRGGHRRPAGRGKGPHASSRPGTRTPCRCSASASRWRATTHSRSATPTCSTPGAGPAASSASSRRSTTSRPARTPTPCISRADIPSCMARVWPARSGSGRRSGAMRRAWSGGLRRMRRIHGARRAAGRRRRRLAPNDRAPAGGDIVRVTSPQPRLPRGGAGRGRRVRTRGCPISRPRVSLRVGGVPGPRRRLCSRPSMRRWSRWAIPACRSAT